MISLNTNAKPTEIPIDPALLAATANELSGLEKTDFQLTDADMEGIAET